MGGRRLEKRAGGNFATGWAGEKAGEKAGRAGRPPGAEEDTTAETGERVPGQAAETRRAMREDPAHRTGTGRLTGRRASGQQMMVIGDHELEQKQKQRKRKTQKQKQMAKRKQKREYEHKYEHEHEHKHKQSRA